MKRMILCVMVAACGGSSDGDDGDDMTPDAAPMDEPTINGKPASEFYGQFAHATSKNEVSGAASFATQADGRNAYHAAFFMLPNGKLELFYSEGEGEVSQTGHSLAIYTNTKKRRSGTWRIDRDQLRLDPYMVCDGTSVNGKDALRCTLSQTIITAAAMGRFGVFRTGIGPSSPDDSEFADYVP